MKKTILGMTIAAALGMFSMTAFAQEEKASEAAEAPPKPAPKKKVKKPTAKKPNLAALIKAGKMKKLDALPVGKVKKVGGDDAASTSDKASE